MEVNLSKTSISIFNRKFQLYKQNYESKFMNIIILALHLHFEGITNGSKKKHAEPFMPQEI